MKKEVKELLGFMQSNLKFSNAAKDMTLWELADFSRPQIFDDYTNEFYVVAYPLEAMFDWLSRLGYKRDHKGITVAELTSLKRKLARA